MAITRRQREVLDFLTDFCRKNDYSPSYEEIARGLGLKSIATVHKHITNLMNKGFVQREHNRSRSIDVVREQQAPIAATGYPLMGVVTAGALLEAYQNEETFSIDEYLSGRDVFVLEVRGDSMRDECILNGDYAYLERTNVAHEGDIVIAVVDGAETTLKRYYIEGRTVRLQPSNSEMDPILVPIERVAIQGKLLGLFRKMHNRPRREKARS